MTAKQVKVEAEADGSSEDEKPAPKADPVATPAVSTSANDN